VSVTIPAGVNNIKVTGYCGSLYSNTPNAAGVLTIWNGAVGSGTQLQLARGLQSGGSGSTAVAPFKRLAVTPGDTYVFNMGINASSGTAYMDATATQPIILMVEAS